MRFRELLVQQSVADQLIKLKKEGRIAHALLLHGSEGNGHLPLAIAYAQFINCEQPEENDSCGECPSCRKYAKLAHPDLYFAFPMIKKGKKEATSELFLPQWREYVTARPFFSLHEWLLHLGVENAQGTIYAEESNEIIRKLSYKTYEAKYKTLIIWLPEKMHAAAANKLLKILEEPPKNTVFILVSEDTEHVLPTVLSRCQLFRVPAIPRGELAQALQKHHGIDEKRAQQAARIANGNYVRAMDLLQESTQNEYFLEQFMTVMRIAYQNKNGDLVEWVEEMAGNGREVQKSFLLFALRMIRENYMLNVSHNRKELVFLSEKESGFASNFHPFVNETNIEVMNEELNRAFRDISANGNTRIVLMDTFLTITHWLKAGR